MSNKKNSGKRPNSGVITVSKKIDAECNVCDWKGSFDEMRKPYDEDDVHKCPICMSENIYYFNLPPRHE